MLNPDYLEIGAIGLFALYVVSKLFEFMGSKTLSPEQQAQNEFYKSFSEFQVEWRKASGDLEKIIDLLQENKTISRVRHSETRHDLKTITNNLADIYNKSSQH